jgi:hypothetical protein
MAMTRERPIGQFQGAVWSERIESLPKLERATPEELLQPRLEKRSFHLYDVPRAKDNPLVIRGKTSEQCVIMGPCFITPTELGPVIWRCTFHGPDVDALFVKAPPAKLVIGSIGLDGCVFRECVFVNVAFYGSEEYLERVRKAIVPR